MRKFTLLFATLFISLIAMAQTKTVEFRFNRTGTALTDIPVVVTVDGVETSEITASISLSAKNTVTALKNVASDIICFDGADGNSSAATETAPQVYTLTINGLSGALTNIKVLNKALTGGGAFQGTSVQRRRHYYISYGNDKDALTLLEDRIDLISKTGVNGSTERGQDFAVNNEIPTSPFIVELKLYNVTDDEKIDGDDALGCYFGLTGFALDVSDYSYSLTQVKAGELMEKTTPTFIAIKNLSYTNNRWFVGNTGGAPYSSEDFTGDAVFIWEPKTKDTAGEYYLRKLNGDYMQATSPKDFGTVDNAAVFTAIAPSVENGKFNGDGDSNLYITGGNDENLVRFVKGANWINVQNGASGTPTYNTGPGGWTIHYVYELDVITDYSVKITDANAATFFAPAEVEIPEGVKAYYLTSDAISNGYARITEINSYIPANTAVILLGAAGEYTFNVSSEGAERVSDNILKGTITTVNIIGDAYVLANPDTGLGLYKIEMKEVQLSAASGKVNVFLNNANKAYLPTSALSAAMQKSNGFIFDVDGTTGITEVETENANDAVIYDLTGRRVQDMNRAGIYIVNGKKVLIK